MVKQARATEPVKRRRADAGLPAVRTIKRPSWALSDRDTAMLDPEAGEVDDEVGLDAPDEQRRHHAISEAAYFLAEKRGFQAGFEIDDWLQAERDIDSAV